ncbi:hypothetical protein KMP13_07860 [Epibacterium ulvae]|uniref:hypothetical protein n=1 Tax=Epibacterium ulvae TaxID=1156985 RepID=UPI001BFC4BD4|nr:hypothetical protein [Epibacterium ulvae]MBT8153808.1 hypothetical protein [Epibacterium ulvae]
MTRIASTLALLCFSTSALWADAPKVVAATATQHGESWSFSVTIRHPDTGWDHYADGWRVLDSDGTELGLRTLFHPHENEQPFTRSLGGVHIPDGVTEVFIQARDNVDGWAEPLTAVTLSQ